MVKRSREDSASSLETVSSSTSATHASVDPASSPHHIQGPKAKYTQYDEALELDPGEVMRCSLPPHGQGLVFSSYEAYDVHYAKEHVNRCPECLKNFPTPHFLNLHIEENHDPLNEARKARGDKIYGCFVEDCERKCSTWQKRRLHLIDKHMFPRNYDFAIVNDGLEKRSSMLRNKADHRRRRSGSAKLKSSTDSVVVEVRPDGAPSSELLGKQSSSFSSMGSINPVHAEAVPGVMSSGVDASNDKVADLSAAMSALKFVPASIKFGRGRPRPGFRNQ